MIEMVAKKLVGVVLLLFGLITTVLAQGNQQPTLAANQEKIYIHFDRPYYTAGETIWFKAYLYNNGSPSLLSNELYLQLEDVNGKVISKKKYPVAGASTSGNFNLADTMSQGYYIIKAITKAIVLDDARFQYSKSILILNPASANAKNTIAKKALSLQFFPESGHLINRIRTQVAFKATDETGNPVSINGVITNDGSVLLSFRSQHDGIGKLSFTPHLGDKLLAEVDLNGVKYTFHLPAIDTSGVYLKVADADSGKIFELTRSKNNMDLFDTVKLIVRMNFDTLFETTVPFGNEQVMSGILKTKDIAPGILHFTVYNKNGIPLAERLSFVNNRTSFVEPEIVFTKRDSSKRAANNFEIKFNDTIQRSFSIAVTDINSQLFPDKENIYSRLLLTSDLRGYVYDPAWYFENDDTAHKEALDNLMLTHGWTRYNWKKEASRQLDNKNDHYLVTISGTAFDVENNKPVLNGTLSFQIISEDSSFQFYDVAVDNSGRFKIDSLIFFGNATIFYKYNREAGKQIPVNLQVDKGRTDDLSLFFTKKINEGINGGGVVNNSVVSMVIPDQFLDPKYKQLSTVVLKSKIKRPEDRINEKYASPIFRSTGTVVLDNINRPYNNNSLDVVNYALTAIHTLAYDRDVNSLVNKKNFSLQTQKNWIVQLLLDESPASLDVAKTITMDRVALIKFYEAGFVGVGSGAPGGALAVYLKKFDDLGIINEAQKYFTYKGYTVTQDFYNPDYSVNPGPAAIDNRVTIYWDPYNTATSSQDIRFNFFNNDISKKLNIVIEGFDAKGRLIHAEKLL